MGVGPKAQRNSKLMHLSVDERFSGSELRESRESERGKKATNSVLCAEGEKRLAGWDKTLGRKTEGSLPNCLGSRENKNFLWISTKKSRWGVGWLCSPWSEAMREKTHCRA